MLGGFCFFGAGGRETGFEIKKGTYEGGPSSLVRRMRILFCFLYGG